MSGEEDNSSPERSGVRAMSRPPAPVQGIRPPQALSLGPNIVQEWKLFRQKWTNYAVITNLSTQDRAYQVALLLHTLGDDALRIYNGFHFETDEDRRTMGEVLAKFEEFTVLSCCIISSAAVAVRSSSMRLSVRGMKTRAFEDCIAICKAAENATVRGHALRDSDKSKSVHKLTTKYRNRSKHGSSHSNSSGGKTGQNKTCLFCGKLHALKKELCPAYGKICRACKMKNHFPGSARCPSTPKVHNVYADDDDSFSDEELPTQYWLGSLGTSGKSSKNRVFAKMSVCNREVVFQLDSGAETNTIGEQYVDCELVRPTSKTLRTWNGSQVRPVGEATLAVLNPRTNETHTTDFIVVPNGFSNLLGLPTLGIMNLIHVNRDIFDIASISEQDVISPTRLYLSTLKANCLVRPHSTCQNLTKRLPYLPATYLSLYEMKRKWNLIVW